MVESTECCADLLIQLRTAFELSIGDARDYGSEDPASRDAIEC